MKPMDLQSRPGILGTEIFRVHVAAALAGFRLAPWQHDGIECPALFNYHAVPTARLLKNPSS